MDMIAKIALAFIILACLVVALSAHDWYPPECCSGRDCAPLPSSRVKHLAGGYLIDDSHFISEKQARLSPDGKYHACFPQPAMLLCFFSPKPSM